jgi:hypothetical protein
MQAQIPGTRALHQGDSATELLEAIRRSSPYPEDSLKAWMQVFAERICKWDGKVPVDCTTPDTFLAALKARRMIRIWD